MREAAVTAGREVVETEVAVARTADLARGVQEHRPSADVGPKVHAREARSRDGQRRGGGPEPRHQPPRAGPRSPHQEIPTCGHVAGGGGERCVRRSDRGDGSDHAEDEGEHVDGASALHGSSSTTEHPC